MVVIQLQNWCRFTSASAYRTSSTAMHIDLLVDSGEGAAKKIEIYTKTDGEYSLLDTKSDGWDFPTFSVSIDEPITDSLTYVKLVGYDCGGKLGDTVELEIKAADSTSYPAIELTSTGDVLIHGKSLFLATHEIGCYYITSDSRNPGDLFGGTWEQISGRFLLPSTSAGGTGGASTVALGVEQMPSHSHYVPSHNHYISAHSHYIPGHSHYINGWKNNNEAAGYGLASSESFRGRVLVNVANGQKTTSTDQWTNGTDEWTNGTDMNTNASGSGAAHENMPPWLSVYCWHRTA